MNKDQARVEVSRLVSKFDKLSSYEKKHYNEANTRKNFIMPLFRALGWDVYDDFNKDEVIEEETTVSGRMDYSFKLISNTRFVLEAKSISEDLDKEQWSIQAVEYGWNKGIPWVVLSDFEGLKVFNSEWDVSHPRPNLDFKYSEYISRFDDLWLLSKDSFQNDLLDKQAQKWGITAKRESVNKYLSDDLIKWREILTKYFYLFNKKTETIETIEESVQKILDRLVFIRVVEDKGLEEKRLWQIFQEWEKNENIPQNFIEKLIPLFRRFNKDYDSNLFIEHVCERLITTQEPFKEIIPNLYENKKVKVKYRFDAITSSTDIFGEVYEQYLGYIQGREGDKSKRKKGGIYYTPAEIVGYIVKETLKPVLDRCTSIHDLKKIKILDPACGSGSFLIKALDVIYAKYKEFNAADGSFTKLNILTDNIYGVDLDNQAIEIARLNLLINACDKKAKLPNLENNIRNGNSLISGTDEELEKRFGKKYLDKKPFNWKEKFPEVFKQGGFDVIIGNPPYIKEFVNKNAFDGLHNSPYYQGKMDLWTMFGCVSIDLLKEGGTLGFIAPNNWITNAGASIFRNKILKEGELKAFIDFGDYKVFKQVGIQTMIFVFNKMKPKEKYLIDYFRILSTTIEPSSLLSSIYEKKIKIEIEPAKLIGKNITFSTPESDLILSKIIKMGNYYLSDNELTQGVVPNPDVINSRNINKIPADDIRRFNIKINDGVFVIPKNYLGISDSEKKYFRPLFDTDQIGRYRFDDNNKKELIFIPKNAEISQNSMLIQHLNKYRSIMEDRRENLSGSISYYNLHWPRNSRFFERGPKIISVRKCKIPTFSYTENESYVMLTFNVIKTDRIDLKYLLALLNSKLTYFWLRQKGKLQGDLFQIDTDPLQQIPICVGDGNQQKLIITLVNKMLELNKKLSLCAQDSEKWKTIKSEIEKTDRKIDEEVYKLYGLTHKEIEIVEGRNLY